MVGRSIGGFLEVGGCRFGWAGGGVGRLVEVWGVYWMLGVRGCEGLWGLRMRSRKRSVGSRWFDTGVGRSVETCRGRLGVGGSV